jgi:hypothetical protein
MCAEIQANMGPSLATAVLPNVRNCETERAGPEGPGDEKRTTEKEKSRRKKLNSQYIFKFLSSCLED